MYVFSMEGVAAPTYVTGLVVMKGIVVVSIVSSIHTWCDVLLCIHNPTHTYIHTLPHTHKYTHPHTHIHTHTPIPGAP